jgi:hypothetical protein
MVLDLKHELFLKTIPSPSKDASKIKMEASEQDITKDQEGT